MHYYHMSCWTVTREVQCYHVKQGLPSELLPRKSIPWELHYENDLMLTVSNVDGLREKMRNWRNVDAKR